MALPRAILDALLGAVATSRDTKPNDEQVRVALEQLAEAAAAILRAMPRPTGMRERFEMQFAQAMERKHSPNQDQEE